MAAWPPLPDGDVEVARPGPRQGLEEGLQSLPSFTAPLAWAGTVPRAGTSHEGTSSGLPAVPDWKTRGPFQERRLQPAGPVVCVQSKQEEAMVGQAGPFSLFGEGIRLNGLVGGGCRPSHFTSEGQGGGG